MKKTDTPKLNRKQAARVEPARRHNATCKTIAWEMQTGEGTHLYTATGQYIATDPAPEKPEPAATPKDNDKPKGPNK